VEVDLVSNDDVVVACVENSVVVVVVDDASVTFIKLNASGKS
jgi:hypothetical protein